MKHSVNLQGCRDFQTWLCRTYWIWGVSRCSGEYRLWNVALMFWEVLEYCGLWWCVFPELPKKETCIRCLTDVQDRKIWAFAEPRKAVIWRQRWGGFSSAPFYQQSGTLNSLPSPRIHTVDGSACPAFCQQPCLSCNPHVTGEAAVAQIVIYVDPPLWPALRAGTCPRISAACCFSDFPGSILQKIKAPCWWTQGWGLGLSPRLCAPCWSRESAHVLIRKIL